MNVSHVPIRVLLADDHQVVRAGIRQFLERTKDLQVIAEAGDGDTAKHLIAEHQPDVAVLDIQMPIASGIEVTRWVRSNYPGIGVLVLTAFDEDPYVLAVLHAGANGYVLKTATPDEIAEAVRDVHAGKSVLNEVVTQKLIAQITGKVDSTYVESLSERELEVLRLAAKGLTNKAIGTHLGISDRTVQGHLSHIFDKLHASSRTEAVMRAVTFGWIDTQFDSIIDKIE